MSTYNILGARMDGDREKQANTYDTSWFTYDIFGARMDGDSGKKHKFEKTTKNTGVAIT